MWHYLTFQLMEFCFILFCVSIVKAASSNISIFFYYSILWVRKFLVHCIIKFLGYHFFITISQKELLEWFIYGSNESRTVDTVVMGYAYLWAMDKYPVRKMGNNQKKFGNLWSIAFHYTVCIIVLCSYNIKMFWCQPRHAYERFVSSIYVVHKYMYRLQFIKHENK